MVVVTAFLLYLSVGRKPGPAYTAGDKLDLPSALYDGASRTLLIIARSDCGDCQAAKPLLTQLVRENRRLERSRVALVVRRSTEAEQAFASDIDVSDSEIVALEFADFRVKRVPTVLVVDGAGMIRFAHENAVPASEHEAFLAQYRDALKRP